MLDEGKPFLLGKSLVQDLLGPAFTPGRKC
jgi:hypothetical protein